MTSGSSTSHISGQSRHVTNLASHGAVKNKVASASMSYGWSVIHAGISGTVTHATYGSRPSGLRRGGEHPRRKVDERQRKRRDEIQRSWQDPEHNRHQSTTIAISRRVIGTRSGPGRFMSHGLHADGHRGTRSRRCSVGSANDLREIWGSHVIGSPASPELLSSTDSRQSCDGEAAHTRSRTPTYERLEASARYVSIAPETNLCIESWKYFRKCGACSGQTTFWL